jgi:hypothetical protein
MTDKRHAELVAADSVMAAELLLREEEEKAEKKKHDATTKKAKQEGFFFTPPAFFSPPPDPLSPAGSTASRFFLCGNVFAQQGLTLLCFAVGYLMVGIVLLISSGSGIFAADAALVNPTPSTVLDQLNNLLL